MPFSRRDFGRMVVSAWPVVALPSHALARQARPNSRVAGVHIGLNVPYDFGDNLMDADEVLQRCVRLGVSAVELRSQPVELALGLPRSVLAAAANPSSRDRTPARLAQQKEALAEARTWRVAVPMSRVREFRRKWEDAGVFIEIVKFDAIYARSDEELDYGFTLAKTLGARAVSCEIDVPETRRLGRFADKHQLVVGYHGHAETGPAHWVEAFGHAKFNGANVDIGHFVAGSNTMPVTDFLKAHHDRVTHIHVKDRKRAEGPNVPFGTGDTPIVEVLQLIRDQKWNIQATIEFEYPVPEGSDRMLEIAKCIEYCRRALA